MSHKEYVWNGNPYRKEYADGLNNLLEKLQKKSFENRKKFMKDIFSDCEKYRQEYKKMLGWPLSEEFDESDIPNTKKVFVADDNGTKIYRVQLEVIDDLWFYGLFFVKGEDKKRPMVIAQHGGLGTVELVSSFVDSTNYNEMVQRTLKYDTNVFVPQLLLWNKAEYGVDFDRHKLDNDLKQVGSSITAIEVYAIMKSINYLSSLDYVDETKIGMVGLSYGGFYTLFTAAADTRIKAALSCSFYNDRIRYNWTDWTWFNSANTFLDKEVALLIYPRFISIISGNGDITFEEDTFNKEVKALNEIIGNDNAWLSTDVFEGEHEFSWDEKYLREFMEKLIR